MVQDDDGDEKDDNNSKKHMNEIIGTINLPPPSPQRAVLSRPVATEPHRPNAKGTKW